MKYDQQINDLRNHLQQASRILVMLPSQSNVDTLAAGLALHLAIKKSGKDSSIVSDSDLKVAHSNLFGVGDVSNTIPAGGGGNLTLSLEGVVDNEGKVPSLEKLDWFPEGNNLNLVFHVLPGQKFEPYNISTKYDGGSFDLLISIGAANIQDLGNVFTSNAERLATTVKVNIDKHSNNNMFGQVNIVDFEAASIAEMVMQIVQGLNVPLDNDIASNIIAGIYDATANLTQNTKAETFMALGQAMQLGGKMTSAGTIPNPSGFDLSALAQPAPMQPVPSQIPVQMNPAPQQNPVPFQPVQPQVGDLVERKPEQQAQQLQQILQPDTNAQPAPQQQQQYARSQYETPTGEYVSSGNPENPGNPAPDWLTPKIFKGGNIG